MGKNNQNNNEANIYIGNKRHLFTLRDVLSQLNTEVDDAINIKLSTKIKLVVDEVSEVQNGVINIINILNLIDEYINNNLHELGGFEYLTKIFTYFGNGLYNFKGTLSKLDFGDASDNLAYNVIGLISEMRYISSIVQSSQREIDDAFDALIGDTSTYQLLNENSIDFDKNWNNNSLLFKFFMMNYIFNKIMESMSTKDSLRSFLFWKVTMKIKMFIFKNAIKTLTDTVKSLSKYTDDIPDKFSEIAKNILTGFTTFQAVIANMDSQKLSLIGVIRFKFRVWKLMAVYKYFIKKLLKITNQAKDIIADNSIQYMSTIIDSVFKIIQSLDIFRHFGFIKLWLNIRKIKNTFESILSIPIHIVRKYNKQNVNIEEATKIFTGVTTLIQTMIDLNNDINTSSFSKKKIKQLRKAIITIIDIISRVNDIESDAVNNAQKNMSGIKDIFDILLSIMGNSMKILVTGIIFSVMLPKVIDGLFKLIDKLNKAPKITKKAKKQFEDAISLLDELVGTMTKIGAILGVMTVASPIMVLGLILVITTLISMVYSMIFLSKIINRYKKIIRAGQKELASMIGTISVFLTAVTVISNTVASAGAAIIAVTMALGLLWLVTSQYFAISKFLKKKRKVMKIGGKILTGLGAALATVVGSLSFAKKIDPSLLIAVLLVGAIIMEMVGIFILISFVKKPVRKGVKAILKICLSMTIVFTAILLLALVVPSVLAALGAIFLTIGIFVGGAILTFLIIYAFRKPIRRGMIMLVLIAAAFLAASLFIRLTYALINNISWEAMGFLFANIYAMSLTAGLIGFLTMMFKKQLIAGCIAVIGVAASFMVVGIFMGIMYKSITNIDWEAMGFLFANIFAMTLTAALIGAIIVATGGLGALALLAGCLAVVIIAGAFFAAGWLISQMYKYITNVDFEKIQLLYDNIFELTLTSAKLSVLAPVLPTAIVTLALIVLTVGLLLVIVGELYLIEKIPLDPEAIDEKIDLLMRTIKSIMDKVFSSTNRNDNWFEGDNNTFMNEGLLGCIVRFLGGETLLTVWGLIERAYVLICVVIIIGILIVATVAISYLMKNIKGLEGDLAAMPEKIDLLLSTISAIITSFINTHFHFDQAKDDDGIIKKICRFVLPKGMMDIASGIAKFGEVAQLVVMLGLICLVAVSANQTVEILNKYDTAPKNIARKTQNLINAVMESVKALNGMEADDKFSKLSENVSSYEKVVKESDKLINKVNGLNLNKMTAFAEMWKQAAAFSHSINGNFDRLASAISEKLAPILKELKDAILEADKTIKERTNKMNSNNMGDMGIMNNTNIMNNASPLTTMSNPAQQTIKKPTTTGKSQAQIAQSRRVAELNKKAKIEECITQAMGGYALNVKIVN